MRPTNPTKRAETRIHLTLWTYLLDLYVHQAYCIYKVLLCNKKLWKQKICWTMVTKPITFFEFKRRICEQMVGPYLKDRTRRLNSTNQTLSEQNEEGIHVGRRNEHILLENKYIKGDNRVSCHLCTLLGKGIRRSHYGCMHCQKGFHVNCFALYHQRWALRHCSIRLWVPCCYRFYTYQKYGHLGKGQRFEVSHCVTQEIRRLFPNLLCLEIHIFRSIFVRK